MQIQVFMFASFGWLVLTLRNYRIGMTHKNHDQYCSFYLILKLKKKFTYQQNTF
jgi:hypothetical protein